MKILIRLIKKIIDELKVIANIFRNHTVKSEKSANISVQVAIIAMMVTALATIFAPLFNGNNTKQYDNPNYATLNINAQNGASYKQSIPNISGWYKMTTTVISSSVEYYAKYNLKTVYHINIEQDGVEISGTGEKLSDTLIKNPKYTSKNYTKNSKANLTFNGRITDNILKLNVVEINPTNIVLTGEYIIDINNLTGKFSTTSLNTTGSFYKGIMDIEKLNSKNILK